MRRVVVLFATLISGCSLLATRPVQDMSDTAAALRAAREVQADVLAPELYRKANELFFKARREYKFKNFEEARSLAIQSRRLAEQAEFDAMRGGATPTETVFDPFSDLPGQPTAPNAAPAPTTPEPYDYPTPEPIPAEKYDERMREQQQRDQQKQLPQAPPISNG